MTRHLIALVAAVALLGAACGAPEGDAAAGGDTEGIQVHGHWTIDVFDPDGTLDSHTEFDNALTSGGEALLSRLLVRDVSMGQWSILLLGDPEPHLCPPFGCVIAPTIAGLQVDSHDIVVERVGNNTARLSGTVEAVQDGAVRTVQTQWGGCGPSVAPANCLEYGNFFSGSGLFTSRTLAAGEVVTATAGQLVQVIVDISFS